jgi:methionine-rich copper-binding protein CopC
MRATVSPATRWLARSAVTALLAGLALLGAAQPAAAHGQLVFAEPAKDSTVTAALDRVSLYFTEKPPGDAYFTLSAPDGSRVDNGWSGGEPRRLDEPIQELNLVDGEWKPQVYNTGFPAVIGVAHWPATGRYVARYLSIASDGDKVQGEVAFSYTGPVTAPPAGWTVPVNQPNARLTGGDAGPSGAAATSAPVAAPAPTDQGTGWAVWLVPGVIVLIAAALIINVVRRSRGGVNARIRADARRAAPGQRGSKAPQEPKAQRGPKAGGARGSGAGPGRRSGRR